MGIKHVFYRSPHNYDLGAASDEATVKEFGPSLTVQSMAEDIDLNVIMRRFGITGKMPDDFRMPEASDFGVSEPMDFRAAQDLVIAGQRAFDSLPADVRSRFRNQAAELVAFLGDEANRAEAVKLGLVKAAEPAVVPPAPVPPEVKPPV